MVYNMPVPIALSMVSKSVLTESSSQQIEAVHEHFIVVQNFGGVHKYFNINWDIAGHSCFFLQLL